MRSAITAPRPLRVAEIRAYFERIGFGSGMTPDEETLVQLHRAHLQAVDLADEFEGSAEIDEQQFGERLASWFGHHFQTHDARLHRLAGANVHQPESGSAMRRMIRDAKQKLLGKHG